MPMQALADDSGCKGQGKVIVIAGLVGQAEWWANFSDKWDACLKKAPAIAYFKMYEAAHRSDQFVGLSETQRDKKLIALVRILNEHRFVALHVTVDLAAHEKHFVTDAPPREKRKKAQFFGDGVERNPYFYTYSTFLTVAAYHLWDYGERQPFEFIIDEHPKLGDKVRAWYPVMRAAIKEPWRSIVPINSIAKDDVTFLPLQAADMIAWVQRSLNSREGRKFEWLNEHFTVVKASRFCFYAGTAYFDWLRKDVERRKEHGPPPIDALIELARLQGAPIPGPKRENP